MGKTYLTERVLAMDFNVITDRTDSIYGKARRHAGIPGQLVIRHPERLRDGSIDADTVEEFFKAFDGRIRGTLGRAKEHAFPAVFEGHSLRLPDEAARVATLAREVLGPETRVIRVVVTKPYDEWIDNILRRGETRGEERREELGRAVVERADRYRKRYDELTAPIEPVDGVEDVSVSTGEELSELAENAWQFQRHRWYQGFTVGPITVSGVSDAHEKANALHDEDVIGLDVLDLCCATGAVGMLLKVRGADSVVGIERMRERYIKAVELRKVLARQAGADMGDVRFMSGDIFRILPDLEPVDTVVALGILHYFSDYERFLRLVGDKAKRALYIEVLRPDRLPESERTQEDSGEVAPNGLIGYKRRDGGTTKWAGDGPTLERIFAAAVPEFELVEQIPTSGLGRSGPDTSREIWRLTRRPDGTPAVAVSEPESASTPAR